MQSGLRGFILRLAGFICSGFFTRVLFLAAGGITRLELSTFQHAGIFFEVTACWNVEKSRWVPEFVDAIDGEMECR